MSGHAEPSSMKNDQKVRPAQKQLSRRKRPLSQGHVMSVMLTPRFIDLAAFSLLRQ
jgi:hypothetical protein